MTKYLSGEPFSIPSGGRDPKDCKHLWQSKGKCVLCGCLIIGIETPYGIDEYPPAIIVKQEEYVISDAGCFVKSAIGEKP